jgi:16S rRNA processing protein RimM
MAASRLPSRLIEVGFVARAHGVRGELRVVLHNPDSSALDAAETVYLAGERRVLIAARPVQGAVLVTLEGIGDRDAAEALRGSSVEVDRDALDLDDGEVLLADLVGCRAVLSDGSDWGEVVRVVTGPQDRLVIRHGDIERELPLVDELVTAIDLDAGTIEVAPPEGLPETSVDR